jgi:UDP-2,3-diacylglucosamine hydrolase
MSIKERNTIYFASDFHLGAPDYEKSLAREKIIVSWLEAIEPTAQEIFLVGDIFDFWFEYKEVIPRGFVRLQGKIAQLTDSGIPVHIFTGNHDMWMFDYLPKEIGVQLHRSPIKKTFFNQQFYIGHGDGLGPGDKGYKFIKRVFENKFCQWCFARLHPNFGIWLAKFSSKTSRASTGKSDEIFKGKDNEWLAIYCNDFLKKEKIDVFIFGHRHLPIQMKLNEFSTYYNLGEWITHRTFLSVNQKGISFQKWEDGKIINIKAEG